MVNLSFLFLNFSLFFLLLFFFCLSFLFDFLCLFVFCLFVFFDFLSLCHVICISFSSFFSFFSFFLFTLSVILSFRLLSFFSYFFKPFCLFAFLSFLSVFCLLVFSSRHHSGLISVGSQVSKVTLCVKILKWHSLTQWPRSGIELPGQLKSKRGSRR